MRLQLQDGSRIFIDLRATGLLRAVAHSPTLTARPAGVTVDFAAPPGESTVEATFRADAIQAPADIPASDREKMVENMRSREVLEASRFPTIDFRGRYAGTVDGGTLTGDLQVRTTVRAVSIPVRVRREGEVLLVSGTWEGRLTDLGIKPFKALLGAIKLEDWIALRLDVRFASPQ